MRWSEIIREASIASKPRPVPRVIRIARRCRKEFEEFAAAFPDFERLFDDFLRTKALSDPPPLFGKKDGPLGSNLKVLSGYWHAHIVYGKALVIYRVDAAYLTLFRITDHLAVESGRMAQLGLQVGSIAAKDEWDTLDLPGQRLPSEQEQAARDLFAMMKEHPADYRTLAAFVAGKSTEALTYVGMVPELRDVSQDALRDVATKVLKAR
jgi:hypothetical protein